MFMRKLVAAALLVAVTSGAGAQNFSEPASEEDIARVYLSVMPDGENLPEGSGTAIEGEPLFQLHCSTCHGAEGEGTLENRLVGGHGTLASAAPVKTLGSYWPYATTVFNYVRRSMPYLTPMTLTDDEYYAITAFLLNKNDIIAADAEMNQDTLPEVVMPNRDGFVNAHPTIPAKYDYKE